MTELFLDRWEMPTAEIGQSNPWPPLLTGGNLDKQADLRAAPAEIRANASYGRIDSICPYLMQDGYTRKRSLRSHPAAVLQNEHLRATVLPALGGRLWSLVHRPTGEELLFANPMFQPANLALRGAWVAGGVEWNIGTIGHSPLSCEPMHAVAVRGEDGTPVLRLYEFERLRRVVYQVDLHLPADSEVLFAHVRITNPNEYGVPMYWWSNIAVPQAGDTRVLAPADLAWSYSYDNVLRRERVAPAAAAARCRECDGPGGDGPSRLRDDGASRLGGDRAAGTPGDISYPARFADSADFFFDLAAAARPFIAAVNGSGTGMFHTSTQELVGRKLFRWGTGSGGRRWQRWLTGSPEGAAGGGYAEIQAGLARTQFEHLPMPAGATWSFTEGYGRIALAEHDAHGPWERARAAAERAVAGAVPAATLAAVHQAAERTGDRVPERVLRDGSGWGALEGRLRVRSGEPAVHRAATPFDEKTLGAEQKPWLELLETGAFPDPPDGDQPPSVHLHPLLAGLLAASPGWAAPALLGVVRMRDGDRAGAREAWESSVRRLDNAYAKRNLAVVALEQGDAGEAVTQYRAALALQASPPADTTGRARAAGSPSAHPALVIEALRAFVAAGAPDLALQIVDALPARQQAMGRIRLLEASAALAAGDLRRCGRILADPTLEVADLREGEDSLDLLWGDYQARLAIRAGGATAGALRAEVERRMPLPAHLDFRMQSTRPASTDPPA